MKVITSRHNALIADAARLHRSRERKASGRTLLEGPQLLLAAIGGSATIDAVFALQSDETTMQTCREHGIEVIAVTPEVLDRLAPTKHPRGPIAVIAIPAARKPREQHTLVLWGVGNPGNAGTALRSAAAFGLDVAAAPNTVDLWAPKTLRAGAGMHFATHVGSIESIEDLRAARLEVAATVPTGGEDPVGSTSPTAWLIGDEAAGLPPAVVEAADRRVTIPMVPGVESLNAAMTASIIAYVVSRPLS